MLERLDTQAAARGNVMHANWPACWLLDDVRAPWRRLVQVDDVVAAVPMHAGCGLLGVLLVGFLARREYVEQLYPNSSDAGV